MFITYHLIRSHNLQALSCFSSWSSSCIERDIIELYLLNSQNRVGHQFKHSNNDVCIRMSCM